MISRLKGRLVSVTETHALVENAGLSYEVQLPSALAERLRSNSEKDREIEFETLYYIEAGDKKSTHHPKLVGFLERVDLEFFSLLIQVPGLGVKKALKSLIMPIREIAAAIENKNAASLSLLPGVGARQAEKIIAELHGKTARFALSRSDQPLAVKDASASPFAEEAISVLLQLQYPRQEAERMVSQVMGQEGGSAKIKSAEALITLIFKNEQGAGVKN